jgi:hypothetical protein
VPNWEINVIRKKKFSFVISTYYKAVIKKIYDIIYKIPFIKKDVWKSIWHIDKRTISVVQGLEKYLLRSLI